MDESFRVLRINRWKSSYTDSLVMRDVFGNVAVSCINSDPVPHPSQTGIKFLALAFNAAKACRNSSKARNRDPSHHAATILRVERGGCDDQMSSSCETVRLISNCSVALRSAFRASVLAHSGLFKRKETALARSDGLPGGTRKPSTRCRSTAELPRTSVAIIGFDAAIASIRATDVPS